MFLGEFWEISREIRQNLVTSMSNPVLMWNYKMLAIYYVQIFFKFVLDNPWDFGELKAMNIWRFLGKLNKMSIVNINKITSNIFEIFIFNNRPIIM
jgi:hypothetical protein